MRPARDGLPNMIPRFGSRCKRGFVSSRKIKAAGACGRWRRFSIRRSSAADYQSYNDVYQLTSNNPNDLTRTPGGSTGGGAAATAAGIGFLTFGSDIGGSIRVPAHFCGLYGHKPTLDLVHRTDSSL